MGTYSKELQNVRAGESLQVTEDEVEVITQAPVRVEPDSDLSKLFDVGQYVIETASGNYYAGDDITTVTLVVT